MLNHPIIHVELSSENPSESAQFYNKLFGWKLEHLAEMDYWSFETEENHGGGFYKPGNPNAGFETRPGDVLIYVYTEDLDGDLARAQELGGTIVKGRTEIPAMGWYGIFRDQSGNRIGLFEGIDMEQTEKQGQEQPREQVATA